MALVELNLKAKPANKYAAYMSDNMAVYILELAPVGSKYCVSPPPEDSDTDYLCLIRDNNILNFENEAKEVGFKLDGADKGYDNTDFISYRKGDVNLIVVWEKFLFDNFKLAADLCKELNLKDKQHRIMVHNAMMHGELKGKKKKPQNIGVGLANAVYGGPFNYEEWKAKAQAAMKAQNHVNVLQEANAIQGYWVVDDAFDGMGIQLKPQV